MAENSSRRNDLVLSGVHGFTSETREDQRLQRAQKLKMCGGVLVFVAVFWGGVYALMRILPILFGEGR